MPHVILEYSSNAIASREPRKIVSEIHAALAEFESFKLNEIKSRWIEYEHFWIGDGKADQAFVHLRLEILSGRPSDIKKEVGNKLMELLKGSFSKACFSIEIRDMDRDFYFKAP